MKFELEDLHLKIEFHRCGMMSQESISLDFVFSPDDQIEKERFQERGQFLYLWKWNNIVLYAGMTTNSIQNRMNQHKIGMRGNWKNGHCLPGLNKPLVEGKERVVGFGSSSGGKKRRFLENAGIEGFEVWTAVVPPGKDLRECEKAIIWDITLKQIQRLKTSNIECADKSLCLCLNGLP